MAAWPWPAVGLVVALGEYVERTSAFFPRWPADRAKPDAGR